MPTDILVGFLAAGGAAIVTGSAFVPTKLYPTYDGMIFQWFMCSGIVGVGVIWGVLSHHWDHFTASGLYVFPHGLIGGAGWAVANAMIPTVVNNIGLSKGFIFWNSAKMIVCTIVQTVGLYGLTPRPPNNWTVFLSGMGLILTAIAIFGRVKPTIKHRDATPTDSPQAVPDDRKNHISDKDAAEISEVLRSGYGTLLEEVHTGAYVRQQERASRQQYNAPRRPSFAARRTTLDAMAELPNFGPYEINALVPSPIEDENDPGYKRRLLVGTGLAVVVGFIFGNTLTPFLLWQERCKARSLVVAKDGVEMSCNPLDMIFSQCLGAYLGSTTVFILYSMLHKYRGTTMPRSALRPAYIAGVLWGLGMIIQFVALQSLPFIVVYPISAIGPAVVSTLWSTFYFHEIQGSHNLTLLAIGTIVAVVGIVLNSLSHPPPTEAPH